jgi:hypothetical protein
MSHLVLRTAQYDSASDHCMLLLVEYALHQKSAVDHARVTTFRRRPSVSQSLGRDFNRPLGRRELSQVLVGGFILLPSLYQGQLFTRGSPIFCPTYAPPLSSFPLAPLAVGSTRLIVFTNLLGAPDKPNSTKGTCGRSEGGRGGVGLVFSFVYSLSFHVSSILLCK